MNKKLFLLLAVMLTMATSVAQNYDFYAIASNGDTLYYTISGSNVTVTSPGSSTFSSYSGYTQPTGALVIPSSVTYNSTTYTVTSIGDHAFFGCSSLSSITIPGSVTSIGYAAFYGCTGLTSATIPSGVTSIGNSAFYNCRSLTSVTIPGSVTSIGNSAFQGCTGLTSVTIPNSVTSIGEEAFGGCWGLTSIEVENGNTTYDCRQHCNAIIETATNTLIAGCINTIIPSSVTSIGNSAFRGCSFTSVIIPSGVTSIGVAAFWSCSSLTTVTIPNSVTSIGQNAFAYCRGLTSIICESATPPTTYANTFSVATNAILYVPCGAVAAYQAADGWSVFSNIQEMEPEITVTLAVDNSLHGTATIVQQNNQNIACDSTVIVSATANSGYLFDRWSNGSTANPDTLHLTGDTSLTAYFVDESDITDFIYADAARTQLKKYIGTRSTVVIPSTVVTIMDSAFYNNTNIVSVTIPDGVIRIERQAFKSCANLISLTIGNSVTSIGAEAFEYCSSLTSVFIPSSVRNIYAYAFCGSIGLTSISVDVDNAYFDSRENCNAIINTSSNSLIVGCPNTVIPSSVTSIGNGAFGSCTTLTSINIPSSVTSIGDYAFNNCSGLTSVNLPNSITTIGGSAFRYCSNLTNLNIPSSVSSIGRHAFLDCIGLTTITVDNNNEYFDSRENCNAIIRTSDNCLIKGCNNTIIPSNVTSIGEGAFYNCGGLTSITIPNGATSIGDIAFWQCRSLTTILIPSSMDTIGNNAFSYCYGIMEIHSLSSEPPVLGNNTFNRVPVSASVYVPCGAVAAYQAADGWSGFTNFQEMEPEITVTLAVDNSLHGTATIVQQNNQNIACDSTVVISATANSGYLFDRWSNGSTANPDTLSLSGDTTLTAFFVNESDITDFIYADAARTQLKKYIGTRSTVVIPSTVVTIMDSAFYDNANIVSVTISDGVTSIGGDAFYQCRSLTSVTIGNGVTSIGNSAFAGCTGLTSVTIPASVTSIGWYAFWYCTGLISVNIGSSVTSIGKQAFCGCIGLTSVTIPDGVISIGVGAFSNCNGMTSLVVSNGNNVYDSRDNCNAIIETSSNTLVAGCINTVIPASVTAIGDHAFAAFIGLTSVTIPDGVTSIGSKAFFGCNVMASLVIGSGVTSISSDAFRNCTGLTEIHSLATVPPTLGNNTFGNVPVSAAVSVPCGTVAAYQAADGWSVFTNFQEDCSASTPEEVNIRTCTGQTLRLEIYNSTHTATVVGYVGQCEGGLTVPAWFSIDGVTYSVTAIGPRAFVNCTGLESVTLPASITLIDEEAFKGCSDLLKVDIK